jgi:hypothetical protein
VASEWLSYALYSQHHRTVPQGIAPDCSLDAPFKMRNCRAPIAGAGRPLFRRMWNRGLTTIIASQPITTMIVFISICFSSSFTCCLQTRQHRLPCMHARVELQSRVHRHNGPPFHRLPANRPRYSSQRSALSTLHFALCTSSLLTALHYCLVSSLYVLGHGPAPLG